jgi:hypothetical protein
MLNVNLKEVVRQFELTLAATTEFNKVKLKVEDDADDMILYELEGEGYCIELRFEEETVGIAHRKVTRLHFRCSYPALISGGHWEPDDVDIVEFADCTSIPDACIAIVANSYAQRIDGIGECHDFEAVYDMRDGITIFEEEV